MCIDVCVILFRFVEKILFRITIVCICRLFISTKRFMEYIFIQINVALHLINSCFIKIYFFCRLILDVRVYLSLSSPLNTYIVCFVTRCMLYMYKSLQKNVCSVLFGVLDYVLPTTVYGNYSRNFTVQVKRKF